MKRTLLALLVGAIMFAAIYAFAASLNLTPSTLGAGTSVVAACQSGTVNVTYSPSYGSGAPAGYRATTVTLNGLDTTSGGCGAKSAKVTLTGPGASNASLGEVTGTVPSSGTTMDLTFSGVNASDVTGVHVVIAG